MTSVLATYLHDHLAGSRFAIDLMAALCDRHSPESRLGRTAAGLVREIQEDRAVLEELAGRVGEAPADVKEAMAWLAEKIARIKLDPDANWNLGTLQAVETLTLGILGKASLWDALATAETADARLRGPNYADLRERARSQYERLERHRLEIVRVVFAAKDEV